ncbi:MAG TPA: VIT1/CCC1 transporter family protein [Chloroflexota bacterium]|nr:VIT1/CCC1 transporter family protein [Chloroflexota bacterium]
MARRLLEGWRGEVEAGQIYSLLAARQGDPRRAEVIRQMAAAEARHRERIEARLRDLGIAIPDPASVHLPFWRRWQVQLAPTEKILRSQEAAERVEVSDRYGRPTGDAVTDALLSDLAHEESTHARTLDSLRRSEPPGPTSGPQAALDRLLRRETGHARGSGWIADAIYGANDGLAAVFGIVAGVSGATGGSSFVLTAGLAGALASALSMATGAFLAARSEAEVAHANLARESQEIEQHPEEEKEELSLYYQLKGLDKATADLLVEQLSRNPAVMLDLLGVEELGITGGEGKNPAEAAVAAGISTGLGAFVPCLPFFWLHGTTAVILAAVISLVAHFLVGAAKSLVTMRTWWAAGLEMTLAGIIVGTVTYAAGLLFPSP